MGKIKIEVFIDLKPNNKLAFSNKHSFWGEKVFMIPLVVATPGEELVIKKIGGSEEVKRHLANLGFNVGGTVTVINSLAGNLIIKVKESRIAVNEDMARRIMV